MEKNSLVGGASIGSLHSPDRVMIRPSGSQESLTVLPSIHKGDHSRTKFPAIRSNSTMMQH